MIGLLAFSFSIRAWASPPNDWLERTESAWQETETLCGNFVFAAHSTDQALLTTGKRCVDRSRGILTETNTPLGSAVDIRLEQEAWHYDPLHPFVVHLIAPEASVSPRTAPGNDIGDWVHLMRSRSAELQALEDIQIAEKKHWRILLPEAREGMDAVWMIDPTLRLPVAMELRRGNRPVLSYGYSNMKINVDIPESHFRIRPLLTATTLEVPWNPEEDPKQAALKAIEAYQQTP